MSKSPKAICLSALVAAAVLGVTGVAHAGDCKQVKFQFTNNMGSKIKVKGVDYKGNEGSAYEDINNKEINTNASYTTDNRTLNKLDSGKKPEYMTVKFDKWDAPNGRWLNDRTMKFTNRQVCNDGHVYNFNMQ